VRNLPVPTIAVGNMFEADHVMPFVAAGARIFAAIAESASGALRGRSRSGCAGIYEQWWPEPYRVGQSPASSERAAERAAEAGGAGF